MQAKLEARQRAIELRKRLTAAEERLWARLRANQLAGAHFRRQHAVGPYITDFCAPREKLIVEVDGRQHLEQQAYDERRTAFLQARGYRVLRFWNEQVFADLEGVTSEIERVIVSGRAVRGMTGALKGCELVGNPALLAQPLTALFCSQKCPAELVLKGYDLGKRLREEGQAVIGGFHSGIERGLLAIFLRGQGGVVVCAARYLPGWRYPTEWQGAIEAGRLTLVAPAFRPEEKRITKETVAKRNALIVELAARIVVIYAQPGGKVMEVCKAALAAGKPVQAIESAWNRGLFEMGADPHP